MPWVPPYFGSYEHLVESLLRNPLLGSGQQKGPPPHLPGLDPHPQPWFESTASAASMPSYSVSPAVSYLVTLLTTKEVASRLKGPLQKQVTQGSDAAVSRFLEDFCGTPPGRIPWPWPGPPPWNVALVAELGAFANTLQEGALRRDVLDLAARVLEKGLGAGAELPAASR